jgi:hypothetical protein
VFVLPASVTISRGRVECAVLGLPWLTVTHTAPEIVVLRARLGAPPLDFAFRLVGEGGQRVLLCPWRVNLLKERLTAAGFALAERKTWVCPWF